MLLLLLSLFSYELIYCTQETKAKFNESALISQYHRNYVQVEDFIQNAKKLFHEEGPVLREGDNELITTRDGEFHDHSNTNAFLGDSPSLDQRGLNTLHTPFLPLIKKSRPLFPFSITPFTTELNSRHLKWDEIFPNATVFNTNGKLRINPVLTELQTLDPYTSKKLVPGLKDQRPKDQNFFWPKSYTLKLRPTYPNATSSSQFVQWRALSSISPRGTTTLVTPNFDDDVMKLWLREITVYTPIEKWVKNVTTPTEITPSYDQTTQHTLQPITQTSVANTKQAGSKDQPPIDRQGLILQPDKPIEVENYGHSTAQSFIEDVKASVYLRTAPEKNEDIRTTVVGGRPAHLRNGANILMESTTAGDVLHRDTPKESPNQIRRYHSKARKGTQYHHSYKRNREKQKHSEYDNEDNWRKLQEIEYPMIRRTKEIKEDRKNFSINKPQSRFKVVKQKTDTFMSNLVTRPNKNGKQREPADSPRAFQFHIDNVPKYEKRIERRRGFHINKTSFYKRLKDRLMAAESQKKAKKLKLKAELLQKIVEGSSYEDAEASLRKNLIDALKGKALE